MIKPYHTRVVVSGDIVEIYEYENPIILGQSTKNEKGRGSGEANQDDKDRHRKDTLTHARQSIRRLVNANVGEESKFVTLTFKDNLSDFERANYEYMKFIQRLKYCVGKKVKYLVVPEFQKRGAIHYHVVFFDLPYIKQKVLLELWGQGWVDIKKIRGIDNLGAYVCKYLNKAHDDERMEGKKCYFTSRNLEKPKEYLERKKLITEGATSLPATCKTFENAFQNEYTGTITYQQYNLKRHQNEPQKGVVHYSNE